jgi:hypothetical protein
MQEWKNNTRDTKRVNSFLFKSAQKWDATNQFKSPSIKSHSSYLLDNWPVKQLYIFYAFSYSYAIIENYIAFIYKKTKYYITIKLQIVNNSLVDHEVINA